MPYRRFGRAVQKQTPGGKWVTIKTHASVAKATAHLRALYANVPHARRR